MTFTIGDLVMVRGHSQKGKNRVNEHGPLWKIVNILPSGKILLESSDNVKNLCWVDSPCDVDFEIIQIVNLDRL